MNHSITSSAKISATVTESAGVITLGDMLEISGIASLRRDLESALISRDPRLDINGEKVSRIDGAVLQLLTTFVREAHTRGCDVQWKDPSPALQRSAQLLGLASALGLHDAGMQ